MSAQDPRAPKDPRTPRGSQDSRDSRTPRTSTSPRSSRKGIDHAKLAARRAARQKRWKEEAASAQPASKRAQPASQRDQPSITRRTSRNTQNRRTRTLEEREDYRRNSGRTHWKEELSIIGEDSWGNDFLGTEGNNSSVRAYTSGRVESNRRRH